MSMAERFEDIKEESIEYLEKELSNYLTPAEIETFMNYLKIKPFNLNLKHKQIQNKLSISIFNNAINNGFFPT